MCDNTDCITHGAKPIKIMLKKDFDYDICYWCQFCINRDRAMVKTKLLD